MHSFNIQSLHLQASTLILVLAILGVILGGLFCIMAWRRSLRPKPTGLLELLRFIIICLAALLLLKPEWRTTQDSNLQPEIAILWDNSNSMSTEDARLPALFSDTTRVVTRADLVKEILNTDFWKPFEKDNKNRVVLTPFSTKPEDPDPDVQALAGTDINEALETTLDSGKNLRAVIMLTDGDWTTGESPVTAAQKLSNRGIPLYALATGSQQRLPDLDLSSITAPTYGIVGENVQIPFTIESSLPHDIRTVVRLRSEDGKERTKNITIPANSTYYDSVLWRIEKEGSSLLKLSIPFAKGELVERNNSREFNLAGRPESIRALVIETLPRWEYRFIRNALSRDPGVQLDCLLLHPKLGKGDGPDYIQQFPENLEELQRYDVVFIGDVGIGENQLTVEQANLIAGLIKNQASGVVFIPGSQGNIFSLLDPETPNELGSLLPVILDEKKKKGYTEISEALIELTSEGSRSLLTMLGESEEENPNIWKSLPGFYWSAPALKAKADTKVLAVHAHRRNSNGRIPIIVTRRAGNGKVLYMGVDSAWRWRRGVEDLYHYRFWGQVARWMSYQRNMAAGEKIRLYFTPERPKPGKIVTFNANAFDDNGAPLQEGNLLLDLTAPDGSIRRLDLEKDDSSWGSYTGQFRITQPGVWKVEAFNPDMEDGKISTKIVAQGVEVEKTGQPARPETLEEMAAITKGQVLLPGQLEKLVNIINTLPEPRPLVDILPLWAHWITATILITLLSIFWIGRKLNGTF